MRKFLIIFLVVLLLGTTLIVGYLRGEFHRLANLEEKVDLTMASGSLPLRVENSAGDFLEIIGFEPAASATFSIKTYGTLKFRYRLRSTGEALVFAKPFLQGKRPRGCYGTEGSPTYLPGTGEGVFKIEFDNPATCDALEVFMEVGDLPLLLFARQVVNTELRLLTMRIPVTWEWK